MLSFFITFSVPHSLIDSLHTISALSQCRFFHFHCYVTHEDGLLSVNEHALILESGTYNSSIEFPHRFQLSSNRTFLGFKSNLNTKYAGSIQLLSPTSHFKLTLSPGLSFMKWYRK
ncbi:hypothetical protein DID78_02480 [Candidatus Marinamargulisbacteria bacterium SCGC AG-343-D04]|nr:hypothetical protein DID78_02480 [Candidatus Marinamargulisbacteria bacterium SCGC AG-343-D04]